VTKRDNQAREYYLEVCQLGAFGWRSISKNPPDYHQDVIVTDEDFRVFPAICNMFGHEPEFIYYPDHKPPEGYTPILWRRHER
jgi:hypothetical protein